MNPSEKLYLALVIVVFAAFIATLAYETMAYEAHRRSKG
jgi:hypothetical protein